MAGGSRYLNSQSVFLVRVDKIIPIIRAMYVNEDEETGGLVYWVGWEQAEKWLWGSVGLLDTCGF